jgi:hypothetical protein
LYFCGINTEETVYIYVPTTAATVAPSTVINQKIRIYKNPQFNDAIPADRGIYGYTANNEYMQGRRWWYGALDEYPDGHWDSEHNYPDDNQGYSVTDGLYICGPTTGGGGNETGGGNDNSNIGRQ